MTRPAAGRAAGFSLIELLVVLALLGLLGLLALGTAREAGTSWTRLARTDADGEHLNAVHELLRDLLARSVPVPQGPDPAHVTVTFSGREDGIELLAPLRASFGAEDIAEYRLRLTSDGELRLGWQLYPGANAGAQPGVAEIPLLDHLADADVSYYGSDDRVGEPQYWSRWTARRVLPTLVRLRFTWRARRREWIFAPSATGWACMPGQSQPGCDG